MPKRRRALSIVAGVLVVAFLGRALAGDSAALDRGDKLASVGGLLLAVGVALSAWRQGRRPPTFERRRLLAEAEQELARGVAAQWDHEARVRGLVEPSPLRTRWASGDEAVTAPAAEILGDDWTGGRPTRLKLHGTIDDVASALRRLPAHQLVLTGPPGAGKTSAAVILVRTLLRTAEPGDPVPVLLSLTTWDPHQQPLEGWLAEAVARQYPVVADAGRFGADALTELLRGGRILPVLDGLDEMPGGNRRRAVTALNNYLTAPRPVVLTCRTEEYRQVIGQVGSPLARAAVVELAEISGTEAADYLPAGQGVDGARRWSAVVRHLRDCPRGALARTPAPAPKPSAWPVDAADGVPCPHRLPGRRQPPHRPAGLHQHRGTAEAPPRSGHGGFRQRQRHGRGPDSDDHLAGGPTFGAVDTLMISLAAAGMLGPVISLASGAGAAWLRLQQARIWLAPRGRIPWRIVDFLDDAHRRGVLRKNGPEYQFRHARVQEFLAARP